MVRKKITFNRGSRRRLRQIRWKPAEIVSLALLAICLVATGVVVVFWELHHQHPYSKPPKDPQLREATPVPSTEP